MLGEHGGSRRRPAPGLNGAIRQELRYMDTVVTSPFRLLRRVMGGRGHASPLRAEADELLEALEGMARLPVHLLRSAFGDSGGQQDNGLHPHGDARRARHQHSDGTAREASDRARDADPSH